MKRLFFQITLSFLFAGILLFNGCNEDPMVEEPTVTNPTDTIPETTYTLLLEQPVDAIQPMDCCTEFTWFSDAPGLSRFQLRTNADLDDWYYNNYLDTLVDSHSFSYQQELIPNATYHWTVQIDTLTASAHFTTEDLLSPFEGSHNIELSSYEWREGLPGPLNDTTYQTTVTIVEEDGRINAIISYFNPQDYYFYSLNDQELSYYLPGGGANYATITIDMQTDSIFGHGSVGSLGGGYVWDFHGRVE